MQPSHYVPPCPVRTLVPSSAAMQPLFCHSLTICRNAAVTLCPSLSCSYPRSIFCRNAAFVLSLIVPSAAMQSSHYVPPCPVRTLCRNAAIVLSLIVPSAAMQPCRVHSAALSTVMQSRECVFGRVWIYLSWCGLCSASGLQNRSNPS
jgi:hypothetical protein